VRRLWLFVAGSVLAACSGGGDQAGPTTPPQATAVAATSTAPATTVAEPVQRPASLRWWNDRVFYEVFVRSFKDSDGDGIGDLRGLTASLDYLNDGDPTTTDDLGITGIWLMPISPSPSYHGYDVTDHRGINPDYGTMEDFEEFLAAAHDRGIAVLVDLVLNHTSREHPWFVASAAGDPAYADWYRWSSTDPGTASPWGGGPLWHPLDGRYYFGLFWEGMPDLNLENPAVTAELHDIAREWLARGVDGFRLDAVRHLIEDGPTVSDTPATVAWLEDFTAQVHEVAPEAMVLGEVWSPTGQVAAYVPDALDLAFEFDLAEAGKEAVRRQDSAAVERATVAVTRAYPSLQYATFLSNHDMDRIMSQAGGQVDVAKLAATWLLTSPGVPFLYYGEEVGLEGTKPDERIRTPMPWSDRSPGLGFTNGVPWEPPDPGYLAHNVASQLDDPDSLLSLYRRLVQERTATTALRWGETVPVASSDPAVFAYLRSHGAEQVLVVLNLSSDAVVGPTLDLPTGPLLGMRGVEPVVGLPAHAPEVSASGGFAGYRPVEAIPPFGFLVLRATPEPSPEPPVTAPPPTEVIEVAGAAEVAVAEQILAELTGSELPDLAPYFSPTATVVEDSGETYAFDLVIPPEAGFDADWDWDGDGTVTAGDVVIAQIAWSWVIATELEATCTPDGPEVVCEVSERNVFGHAAGLGPTSSLQRFRVTDGLISQIATDDADDADEAAWLAQFAAFEQWVADEHPDRYAEVFRGPCCAGTPNGMRFTAASFETQRELLADWQP
jgi:glycosidase